MCDIFLHFNVWYLFILMCDNFLLFWCVIFFFILMYDILSFLYPATLKSVGYYVIPSIQKIAFERPSVCPSVCLYVPQSAHRFHSLLGAFFNQFSSNLLWELILERSVRGLQTGKFWQISTELLRPLIDVRNWFSLSLFDIPLPIFFKLGIRVYIVKECSWIADGQILTNKYRFIALDWC